MAINLCKARIRGIPNVATVKEINARLGPSTNHPVVYRAAVGLDNLNVIAVRPDEEGKALDGKTYQWFHLLFPIGVSAWVRDDLLEISGDCAAFGYRQVDTGVFNQPEFAFALRRDESFSPPAPTKDETPPAAEKSQPQPSTLTPIEPSQPQAPVTPPHSHSHLLEG